MAMSISFGSMQYANRMAHCLLTAMSIAISVFSTTASRGAMHLLSKCFYH